MPIQSNSSYVPTATEFIANWTAANAALPPLKPIIMAGAVNLATLIGLRDSILNWAEEVESARNGMELARADIELTKASLLDRLNQFIGKLVSVAPGSRWVAAMPKTFGQGDAMGKVMAPLNDMKNLWERYNTAADEPLELRDEYTETQFGAELQLLRDHYIAYDTAVSSLKLARASRNEAQNKTYEILKNYRKRLPTEFAPDHPVVMTLPRLTPLPGHTPAPVQLTGTYEAATAQPALTWTASADATLAEYQVRGVEGLSYEDEDATVLATIAAGEPTEWTGPFGLGAPGTAASFKVYVVLSTGNESGSNAATVTRP